MQKVWEGVFLDDPSREKFGIEELKSFTTVDGHQTCSAWCNDVQLCCNGTRGYACNNIVDADEPVGACAGVCARATIDGSEKQFYMCVCVFALS